MELQFEAKTQEVWREYLYREEKLCVDLEGVVPDVNEDVGRIASVNCTVLLKSKETDSRGIRIGGELTALLLCITENADAVQTVTMKKEFTFELEGGNDPLREAQASLRVLRTEARVLNPRKLAVSAEIACTVNGWGREEQMLSLLPQEEDEPLLCGQECCVPMQLVTSITEKSFVVTDSFDFAPESANVLRILGGEAQFHPAEQTRIGSRVIVKGVMELSVLYEAEGLCCPLRKTFSSPFSQILDLGGEAVCCCTLSCETTALYLDLKESISGGKALDAEAHAVLQLVGRSETQLVCLRDVYSNALPITCEMRCLRAPQAEEATQGVFEASELIAVAEDCSEVLSVVPDLSPDGAELHAELDILYRSRNGDILSAKRTVVLKGKAIPENARVLAARLLRCELKPEGEGLQCEITAVLIWQRLWEREVMAVCSVCADEDHPFDRGAFPAVTLVRREDESLWELARGYHSTVTAIEAMNETGTDSGSMLMIPRE